VLSLHIGAGFDLIQKAPEAPIDHLIVLTAQISVQVAQDLLFGPTLRRFPDLKVSLSVIAWECDYPHTDTTWPESPEFAWKEFMDSGCSDEEIHKITWENSCRFFGWDPFQHTPKEQATVGALRALATDVDTTRMSREEWRKRNEAAGIGVF
jgi:hypothetical protein